MNPIPEDKYQRKYYKYTFLGKRVDEEIILVLRRHWLVLFARLLPMFFFFILIALFHVLIPSLAENFFSKDAKLGLYLIEIFIWMFFWITLFIIWIDYYFDVWIVTDQRVVNIEQKGLFFREVSELEHSKIQDVTTEVLGFIPTILKFGNVYIQTAGAKGRFVFKQVPDPVFVRSVIMKLQKHAIHKEKIKEGQIFRGKI